MVKVTISELKDALSAYLKKVRAGQAVLVMDRDEPVARIERVEPGGTADDRLGRLERAGLLRRGRRRVDVASLRAPAPRAAESVLAALLEERAEGR